MCHTSTVDPPPPPPHRCNLLLLHPTNGERHIALAASLHGSPAGPGRQCTCVVPAVAADAAAGVATLLQVARTRQLRCPFCVDGVRVLTCCAGCAAAACCPMQVLILLVGQTDYEWLHMGSKLHVAAAVVGGAGQPFPGPWQRLGPS
jgi:hypothetical protein